MSDEERLKAAGDLFAIRAGYPVPEYRPSYKEILDFIDSLRARGVTEFSGIGLTLRLAWNPDPVTSEPKPAVDEPKTDIGGGLMVPKSVADDLFGHETT